VAPVAEVKLMSASYPEADREEEALKRAQRSHEASMDEILASIRAIIADDKTGASSARPVAGASPQVIYSNFGQPKAAEPPVPPARELTPQAPSPTVVWSRPDEPDEAPPQLRDSGLAEEEPEEPLLAVETDRAIAASFQSLTASLALPSPERLEELARETLRPMVKAWLDEHLPSLVERLVKAEIQRVSRGSR
jgi:cell pole-organizing protein PopZ